MRDGPAAIRWLGRTGPKLFYIEDPWGDYTLQSHAESWAEQLPRLLKQASRNHQYVVTSRRDMLRQSKADDQFTSWLVELNAEQYEGGELEKIYDKRMAGLPSQRQTVALHARQRVLDQLKTPLELQLFFSGLLNEPAPEEMPHAFLERILEEAHRDAVAGVVVRYLNSFDDIRIAVAIWTLLVRGGFSRQQLVRLQRATRGVDPALSDSLGKAVDRLIATKHLRQPLQTVSFAHPSVREGFEKFMLDNWWTSSAALVTLIEALVGLDEQDQATGLEAAAHVLLAAIELATEVQHSFETPCSVREAIDAWLAQALVDPRAQFPPLIHLAAKVGSVQSIPAELARWLLAHSQPNPFDDQQNEPAYSEAWYERVRNEPASATIAARFVREQLLQESDFVGIDFLAELDRIADGLTPAFLAAAEAAAGLGFQPHVEIVAAGAVRDIEGYEAVLNKALDALALAWATSPEEMAKVDSLRDDELDAPEVIAFHEQYEMAGVTEQQLIEAYIDAKRRQGRWRDIENHPRAAEIRRFWTEDAARPRSPAWSEYVKPSPAPACPDEIEALLDATQGTKYEPTAWEAAGLSWSTRLKVRLGKRLTEAVDHGKLRKALVYCACENAPDILKGALHAVVTNRTAFVTLLANLHTLAQESHIGPVSLGMLDDWHEALEVLGAFVVGEAGGPPVGADVLALLEDCTVTAPLDVLAKVVPTLIALGKRPANAIQRWLMLAHEGSDAAMATDAAIKIGDDTLMHMALNHIRADARSKALAHLSGESKDPLPARLLELADDRSSKVRLVLIRALKNRPHAEHELVLTRLAHDQWSDAEAIYEEPIRLTVARAALAALAKYPSLQDSTGIQLLTLATTSADQAVRRSALRAAASRCGTSVRQALWMLANDENFPTRRALALVALRNAPVVEPAIVGEIDASMLKVLPPELAVAATDLLATHAPPIKAAREIEAACHLSSHRALLLVGAFRLGKRDRNTADGLLSLLPQGHPAQSLLDGSAALPEAALDDLGEVRIRYCVKSWLKARAKQASAAVKVTESRRDPFSE